MPRYAAALTLMLVLAGCSDSVTLIEPDQIASFKVGTTSQAEIGAALGKPTHTVVEADGTKIDQYPYEGGASGGGSIIPSFLGGSSTPDKYGMVSFTYTASGVLKSVDTGK